jgi:hypothetical protein
MVLTDVHMLPIIEPKPTQMMRAPGSSTSASRNNLVRILFIHRSSADVDCCLSELRRTRFNVISDRVVTPEQFVDRLSLGPVDLIVAEHPSTNWEETEVLDILGQMKKGHTTHLFGPRPTTRDGR